MEDPATEKQIRFLNILISANLGSEYRKTYLKLFYKVDSSKQLTKEEAHRIIEDFLDDNPDREKNKAIAMEKIYTALGQQKLFEKQ